MVGFDEESCDSLMQFRLPFGRPIRRHLTIDGFKGVNTLPETQAELQGCDVIILSNSQPFRPAPVEEEIVRLLRLRSLWPEGNVDRIITVSVDVVAAGETDIIRPQLYAQEGAAIREQLLGNTVEGVTVRMGKKFRLPAAE